jgi:hypothetical protein
MSIVSVSYVVVVSTGPVWRTDLMGNGARDCVTTAQVLGGAEAEEEAYFRNMPRNIFNFEVSSGGFSAPCAGFVDMTLSSVDIVLVAAELLGVGAKELSVDEDIAVSTGCC